MSRRPIPAWPRGPRRTRRKTPELLLGCPRVSPEWELSVINALMRPKPQTRGRVQHRTGEQQLDAGLREEIDSLITEACRRLGVDWPVVWPERGEYFFMMSIPSALAEEAKALTLALSHLLPEMWIVVGRLFAKGGRFHRRRFGYQMQIVRAKDVHVSRNSRSRLIGLLK